MKRFPLAALPLIMFGLGSSRLCAQLDAGGLADVGFTDLQARLGLATPTGAGVSVSQIEAFEGSNYRPDASQFPGHNFTYASGGSTAASGHATTVGAYFYGSGSLAPGIGTGTARITSYSADGWINDSLLAGTASQLPAVETNDIQNSSWVGSTNTTTTDIETVRRLDYAIQRDDFVSVVGLNNGSGSTVPPLLAGAYNGITVGLSNGNHSSGTSPIEGARTRPDLVVPTYATSFATPVVASAAALLMETSRTGAGLANGQRSFVVKSLLMAGATRDETEFTRPWAHTSTQPLDATYGAGELNIDNAHQILTAGEFAASASADVGSTGWDLGATQAAGNLYFFDVGGDARVSAALVWNRLITATDVQSGPGISYDFSSTLQNLDLRLYSATGFSLGVELDSSVSTIDNVELITTQLAAGRYAWQVVSDTAGTEYGLSWQAIAVPEPSAAGLVAGCLILAFRRRRI